MLDPATLRPRFPALATDWALFDNAGGSVTLGSVTERVRAFMEGRMVQLGASYSLSRDAAREVDAGRRAVAELTGSAPEEIVFGASSTALVQLLARALRPLWKEGDEVIVTNLDHETNIGPWRDLEQSGIVVREWRFSQDTLDLELEDLEPLLSERTRLVCASQCSNLFGRINDVARLAEVVHAHGAELCVDGVAYAPHRRIDVRAWDVDYYCYSLYKVYGPHLGVLYGKRELLERAKGQNHAFVGEDRVPLKFEPGNVCYELAASLPAIVEYLTELGEGGDDPLGRAFERIAVQEEELARPLLEFLAAHPRARVLGPESAARDLRVPTVSFVVPGRDSAEIPAALDERRVAVRFGHFYAWRAARDLGLLEQNGVVRASMAHYNTPDEVSRLVEGLDAIL